MPVIPAKRSASRNPDRFGGNALLSCKDRLDSRVRGNDGAHHSMRSERFVVPHQAASDAYLKTTIPNRSGL